MGRKTKKENAIENFKKKLIDAIDEALKDADELGFTQDSKDLVKKMKEDLDEKIEQLLENESMAHKISTKKKLEEQLKKVNDELNELNVKDGDGGKTSD